jgi:hypothetical protein
MGEANRRGTFADRVAQAKARTDQNARAIAAMVGRTIRCPLCSGALTITSAQKNKVRVHHALPVCDNWEDYVRTRRLEITATPSQPSHVTGG